MLAVLNRTRLAELDVVALPDTEDAALYIATGELDAIAFATTDAEPKRKRCATSDVDAVAVMFPEEVNILCPEPVSVAVLVTLAVDVLIRIAVLLADALADTLADPSNVR